MGKGRARAVEKGVLGQNLDAGSSFSLARGSLHVPPAPVYYPTEEEFRDPLEYIEKIRAEAEPYGICKIVPPESWAPPFALSLESFSFPTKTQAIHQLQVRNASCDPKTFELEYGRFLEEHYGKKLKKKKRVIFEGEELDLCKLFNAVKRFGGYDKVAKEKKWGEVSRFVRMGKRISDCAKHVLGQLYLEHLYDYEEYYHRLSKGMVKCFRRGVQELKRSRDEVELLCSKRRRKNTDDDDDIRLCDLIKKEEKHDQICEQCRSGLHGEVMLLCDRCDKGWHIYCLSPPLKQVPLGNWYCFECLNSDKDSFGFVPGKCFTLEEFRCVAERARRKWFGSGPTSRVQIEKKFWEIVEGSAGQVEVKYGSDLDTSIYGSGFPRLNDQQVESVDSKVWEEYCGSPWNLNNLPKLKGSMLQAVHQNITGVMVPWLYMGMLFSSFCWHFEDHCFYSMNYLHWGEPKCWYSVPGCEASAFEKVMRDSLPDLFDAQPDLLFQLVTMLNPSVLQEKGVPVYTVLQEPRNFVITFPRSYHGGFNFGLNCAEAVNFAPADWLPHGGFAAELYQMYRKTAVLSHEELLCVVAKGDCDDKVSPYLKNELLRIYTKEKTWRERLWRNGLVKSSPMTPRQCPEFIGTEEDPICIICKQFLYLSAVVCSCRPSAFVCLEHWKQICECRSSRLRLLYRHTLSELHDLVHQVDKGFFDGTRISNLQRQISSYHEQNAFSKKVKGCLVSLAQLAEEWHLRSCSFFQNPYSADTCTTLLKEAEQFLWAGPEINPVRDAVKNIIIAQKWAGGIQDCLSKISNWSCHERPDMERVKMEFVNELLDLDPVPCNEPGHLKLKVYAEEARLLIQEINSALSSWTKISELETLYTRASNFPICVEESEVLLHRISNAKVWMDDTRKCLSEQCFAAINIDTLYKLKSEIMELQVQLPEIEMLLDLLNQAALCRGRCIEILKDPCSLKNVELVLQEWDEFTVNLPELMLLKQCHVDAVSWTNHCEEVLVNAHERDDQDNVIDELNHLLKDGTSLRIQVGQLSSLEVELKKACCRQKALRARHIKMSFDVIKELVKEAVGLQIETEKLFVDISGELAAAICWEEIAANVLAHQTLMSDFEDLIRSSAGISVMLPSLDVVKEALATANSWLKNTEPFLGNPSSSNVPSSHCLLKPEKLKDLVLQSKSLKISLKEERMLKLLLKNCEEWEWVAFTALHDVECMLSTSDTGDVMSHGLVSNMETLVTRIEAITKDGISLGFNFPEIPKLQNACSVLQWCIKAFSLRCNTPSFEDIEMLMEVAENLSATCFNGTMWSLLMDGVKWLRRALKVTSVRTNAERCSLSDAEEILAQSQGRFISFPGMVDQLVNAIEKHKLWCKQVHEFYGKSSEERSWSLLLELKEIGKAAFECSELDMIVSEVNKIQKWKQQCMETGIFVDDENELLAALQKIKQSLDMSLYIYGKLQRPKASGLFICCNKFEEAQDFRSCSSCEQRYHLLCLEPVPGSVSAAGFSYCSYCHCLQNGLITRKEGGLQGQRLGCRRPELRSLIALLSDAENFSVRIEEKEMLREVVGQALECNTCLREILDFAASYFDKDLNIVVKKLAIAFKAMDVAFICDQQGNCDLELAMARNSWKVRVNKLLGDQKPSMYQIQRHIKEGLTIGIHPEDYFSHKLRQLRQVGLHWVDQMKKVAANSGAVNLDTIFELISDGENLPVYCEKELKLLRAQSILYCICRKPYDNRAKVTCDQCQEWYHMDCIKLVQRPKVYVCAACKPEAHILSEPLLQDLDGLMSAKLVEPKTPSPKRTKSRLQLDEPKQRAVPQTVGTYKYGGVLNRSSGIEQLWWRNRKPFRRVARKRTELDSLSTFFPRQQVT